MLEVKFKQADSFIQYLTSLAGPNGYRIINPASGAELGMVPRVESEEALRQIESSRQTFTEWRSLPAKERSAKLHLLAQLVRERREELSRLLTLEQGKSIREARGELDYGASYLEWFAGEAVRVYGEIIPSPSDAKRILVQKEPLGVVGMITPWNFPHAMIARKMAAALAAGCVAICKPALETPFSAYALEALSLEAGIPRGVFRVLTGEASEIGQAFMSSSTVRKVSFTGSTAVGKLLIEQSAKTVKKLTLELGGNAPFIVFEDANISEAVSGAVFAKFRNGGQTCVSINRFLLHESISERFIEEFSVATRELKIGDGLGDDTDIGPLISTKAVSKVREFVEDACAKGARIRFGSIPSGDSLFVAPLILTGVTEEMKIWNQEVFGPVAAFRTFSTFEEAITLANATDAGLVSYFYSSDPKKMFRVVEALESGMVGVNDTRISIAEAPFGGVKHSGYGREGGRQGIEEYLTIKYTSFGISC